MPVIRDARSECNQGSTPVGDLLPGWCRQDPINDVQLYYDKRTCYLLNKWKGNVVRATIARRLTAAGTYKEFSIVVSAPVTTDGIQQSHLVVWLENPDRGSLELLDAQIAEDDGSLEAEPNLYFDMKENKLTNGHRSPVYVCMDIEHRPDGKPSNAPPDFSRVRWVLTPGRTQRWEQPGGKSKILLRAAEPQVTTLYMAP